MNKTELTQLLRQRSSEMKPVETGAEPQLQKLPRIRAVIFDIYGTLFISGSGDISLAEKEDHEDQMRSALAAAGMQVVADAVSLSDAFYDVVREHQEKRRKDDIRYPEVDIRKVWEHLLKRLTGEKKVKGKLEPGTVDKLAVEYECRANPVWPMPGLIETLKRVRESRHLMGIVSNAQFYTPLMIEAFAESSLHDLGFHEDCCVWSYRELEGKPSRALFRHLMSRLSNYGIGPEQALYVGNDVRNDIWPAQEEGFRTALFAGDKRSLRLRKDDSRCAEVKPDVVVTELPQILECI